MKPIATIMMALICAVFSNYPVCAQNAPEGTPVLHIWKTKVVLGQDFWFYIAIKGVTSKQIDALIKAGGIGQIEVTAPDGKVTTHPADWRGMMNGDTYRPFGQELFTKAGLVPGRYTVVFIYAGQRTPPVSVTFADVPALKQIQVALHLESASGFPQCLATIHATLTVQNHSDQTVRFPRLNGLEGTSIQVCVPDQGLTSNFGGGMPVGKAWQHGYTWDVAETVPTVTLKPGEKFEQSISMKSALKEYLDGLKDAGKEYRPVLPCQYEVTLWKRLPILLGERHDALADFFPVELKVMVTTEFTSGAPAHK